MIVSSGRTLLALIVRTGPEYLWYNRHVNRDLFSAMIGRQNGVVMLVSTCGFIFLTSEVVDGSCAKLQLAQSFASGSRRMDEKVPVIHKEGFAGNAVRKVPNAAASTTSSPLWTW